MAFGVDPLPQREKKSHSLYQTRLFTFRAWGAIGALILAVAAIYGLGMIASALELFFVGALLAFICSPIVNWLEDHKVPRGIGAFIALLVVLGVATLVGWILIPPFIDQATALFNQVPAYLHQAQTAIEYLWNHFGNSINSALTNNLSGVLSTVSGIVTRLAQQTAALFSSGILPNIMGTFNNLFIVFLGLVLAYWLACDYPTIVREISTIAGPAHEKDIALLLAVLSRSMGGYMRGIVISASVAGILSFFGFLLLGHPYASLMGIAVFICSFVPVVGPWVSTFAATALAFVVGPNLALATFLVAVLIHNGTDNLVSPLVMRSAVKVHPALSLISIMVGASLGGVLGMAFAIPLSAAIKGGFVYYFERRTGRQIISWKGALFKGTPYHDEKNNPVPTLDAIGDPHFFEDSRLVSDARPAKVEQSARPDDAPLDVSDLLKRRSAEFKNAHLNSRNKTKRQVSRGFSAAQKRKIKKGRAQGAINPEPSSLEFSSEPLDNEPDKS